MDKRSGKGSAWMVGEWTLDTHAARPAVQRQFTHIGISETFGGVMDTRKYSDMLRNVKVFGHFGHHKKGVKKC